MHLKELFDHDRHSRRSEIVLVLAGVGHAADAEFLARVLEDPGNDEHSRRYAVAIDAGNSIAPVLARISPPRPHPSQVVIVGTRTPAQTGDVARLTDARGNSWDIPTGVTTSEVGFTLPDEVADGEATVRIGRTRRDVDEFSAPLQFDVTSGPLALASEATSMMEPVAPGQWTDLVVDSFIEFEIRRADRIEVEFAQNGRSLIMQTTGPDRVHVQVPETLSPGAISVRTRTWIEQTASDWSSSPTAFTARQRPIRPGVTSIEAGPIRTTVWWAGESSPRFVAVKAGVALVRRGQFPVATAAALRVQLRGPTGTIDLPASDVEGGVRIEVPDKTKSGEWRLFIGPAEGSTPMQRVTTVRIVSR